MTLFQKVTKLFQSIPDAVRVANVLDKAYADATDPAFHTQFDVSNPQMVAMNQAGLYAADTAANILAALAYKGEITDDMTIANLVTEESYFAALTLLAAGKLSVLQRYLVKNMANLAWRAGQPFRDIVTKPLSRILRDVNAQFNCLPADEQDKDLVQTRTGAALLISWINNN